MRHSFNVSYGAALQLPDDAAVCCLTVIQQQGITAGMSSKPYMLDTIISFQLPSYGFYDSALPLYLSLSLFPSIFSCDLSNHGVVFPGSRCYSKPIKDMCFFYGVI